MHFWSPGKPRNLVFASPGESRKTVYEAHGNDGHVCGCRLLAGSGRIDPVLSRRRNDEVHGSHSARWLLPAERRSTSNTAQLLRHSSVMMSASPRLSYLLSLSCCWSPISSLVVCSSSDNSCRSSVSFDVSLVWSVGCSLIVDTFQLVEIRL